MQQVLLRGSEIVVEHVPAPALEPGHVLVRTRFSCISVGTEMAGVSQSSLPVWRRAVAEKDRVVQVARLAKTIGVRDTISFVQDKLSAARPLGYSLSGVVERVGEGVTDLAIGDLVACGGAQCANHAELVAVPKNLVVRAPANVSERDAATATVGAIALQGVRRANPTIGERFVVIGLGLLGLLTVQILKANGCVVVGIDLDPKRVALARSLGADLALAPSDSNALAILEHSHGYGADGTIITAGSKSDAIISNAFKLTRKRGRVVIVGDVGLTLKRSDFYAKEIDVLISCSYGPGRYDRIYEEDGLDYPLPFVRWTEARNMECFLELIAQKRVSIDALSPVVFPVERAADAYAALAEKETAPLSVFLAYPARSDEAPPDRTDRERRSGISSGPHKLRLGIVGVGSFAGAVHLPNIRRLRSDLDVVAVASRNGHRASQVASQLNAEATGVDELLERQDLDAVLIATRHDSHAQLAMKALQTGKHVFVEKPTVLTRRQLVELEALVTQLEAENRLPVLMTGYNRRFSGLATRAKSIVSKRTCPVVQTFRMAAGLLPSDHWVKGPAGGGRNIGEACHIYDLFTFLVDAPVKSVRATRAGSAGAYGATDNFVTTVDFEDGSVATLIYTAQGSSKLDKERWEIFSESTAIVIDNWNAISVYDKRVERESLRAQDKGFENELRAFVAATRTGHWPIPWAQQRDSAEIAFRAQVQLTQGMADECAE